MPEPIAPGLRAELDQTPEWWDAEFRRLVRKQIPRDAAYHSGHEVAGYPTYANPHANRHCMTCGVPIQDPPDG